MAWNRVFGMFTGLRHMKLSSVTARKHVTELIWSIILRSCHNGCLRGLRRGCRAFC